MKIRIILLHKHIKIVDETCMPSHNNREANYSSKIAGIEYSIVNLIITGLE